MLFASACKQSIFLFFLSALWSACFLKVVTNLLVVTLLKDDARSRCLQLLPLPIDTQEVTSKPACIRQTRQITKIELRGVFVVVNAAYFLSRKSLIHENMSFVFTLRKLSFQLFPNINFCYSLSFFLIG